MICCNIVDPVCNYGANACYCTCPTDDQIAAGVFPLDSLPAGWWNWMWSKTNASVNQARTAVGAFINEFNTVLSEGNVTPNCNCVDQLYRAINNIRQRVGNASTAGSVKSSSNPSAVAIDENGYMTVNCLGNAASLSTSAHTVVGAINELNSTFSSCISSLNTCTTTLGSTKAPTSHASANITYGVGSATAYGHVKVSDVYSSCVGGATEAIAASQKAVYDMYTAIMAAGFVTLGNTVGCALGTASAGTATTAARSDHVHQLPSCIEDKYDGNRKIGIGYGGPGLTSAQIAQIAAYSTNYENGCTIIKDVTRTELWSWLCLGSAACYCSEIFINVGGGQTINGSLTASCFCGALCGVAGEACRSFYIRDYGDSRCNIFIGYAGSGLTSLNITHLAGYCRDSSDNVFIKDIGLSETWNWFSNCVANAVVAGAGYATSAGCACHAYQLDTGVAGGWATFKWDGQSGQPDWVWGSNNGLDMKVWNPANFSVAYAASAGYSDKVHAYYVYNSASCPVYRDGAALYNNSGSAILYYSNDEDEAVYSLLNGHSASIGSGRTYYYIPLHATL